MTTTLEKHTCAPENASKMIDWIANRGGVAVWRSINLSNPGASWSSPACNVDGTPTAKPSWQADNQPHRIITDPHDIVVIPGREVKRFRVGLRQAGLSVKLTDGATRKVHAAVAKAGDGAWYAFDYETQEAVIYVPDNPVSLADWRVS